MEFIKANGGKLLIIIGILVAFVAMHTNLTVQTAGQGSGLLSHAISMATSLVKPSGDGVSNAAASPAGTPGPSSAELQAQSVVDAYIRKNATPESTFSFLDWSGFYASGATSAIILHYRVQRPAKPDAEASVRFTLLNNNVVHAELMKPNLTPVPQMLQASTTRTAPRPVMPAPPPFVVDHFSGRIFSSAHGPSMAIGLNDAFSLSQLEQAKAKAIAERKPLGFLMVWGQFFGDEEDPRGKSSVNALVHFYEVFNDNLVLVFVRHESELGQVPNAVKKGFFGMNEGGFAPNMAVTDASATEFITEIPYKGLDGDARDQLFAEGGKKIDEWLAYHPMALPTPAPDAPPQ